MTVADDDRSLELLRASHIKSKGDGQARAGNWGRALEQYTRALEVCLGLLTGGNDGEVMRLVCNLRLNMSLSCGKCLKWELALEHADAVLDSFGSLEGEGTFPPFNGLDSKQYQKARWRRGEALMGLKRPEEAVYDYVQVHSMESDEGQRRAYRGKVEAVVRVLRGMPERMGALMRGLVDRVIEKCTTKDTSGTARVVNMVEEVDELTMNEAAYLVVKEMEMDGSRDELESAYETCCRWLLSSKVGKGEFGSVLDAEEGLGLEEALVWRSRVYCKAKAYSQAREDAVGALRLLEANVHGKDTSSLVYRRLVMSGYVALGKALNAEDGCSGRDGLRALKALRKAVVCMERGVGGMHVMGNVQGLYDLVHEVTEGLTKEEVDAVEREIGAEGTVLDRVDRCGPAGGKGEERDDGELVGADQDVRHGVGGGAHDSAVLEVRLAFGADISLTPFCREQLRKLVASCGEVDVRKVGIEGVGMHDGDLVVRLQMETVVGGEVVRERVLGSFADDGMEGVESIDSMDLRQLKDVLGELLRVNVDQVDNDSNNRVKASAAPGNAVTKATKPELQLSLPYKDYKLVDAVGRPIERGQKHAFCMSRVYYDRSEMESTETWVELADGSCRWRQSASELKVIALRVPQDLAPRQIEVRFGPYELRVTNKSTGEMYLSGKLHRGIIPDECFWTQLGGEGEDGFLITMTKMNLEVLQKHWMHSEMWWSKLFVDHPECQWDDYSKDYSDLPEEVMERHRIREAQKEETRAVESKDEKRRKRLTGEQERRKRNRMNRLSLLREGAM